MNVDFDMENRLAAAAAGMTGNHAAQPLDWQGLRARMAAAYAVRPVLEPVQPQEPVIDGGSFDRGSARALAVYGRGQGVGLGAVNPTALANGNSGCDTDADVAGSQTAGD
ncbi:MAG: hypothetical protein EOO76_14390 [Novosphingobium sp.]|nr:MAG: hypothetical protein EOO76_14390 [Novosphingobium sp.]